MVEDAETVIVAAGTSAGTCRHVARSCVPERGERWGWCGSGCSGRSRIEDIAGMLGGAQRVAVLDQAVSPGADGALFQEIRAALYGLPGGVPRVYSFVSGLGGRDIMPGYIESMVEAVGSAERNPLERLTWLGLKQ